MKRKLISDNPNEVIRILFRKFGLKYDAIVKLRHKKHPQYPSFDSIAYILSCYGVDSCLIETTSEELAMLPQPLVVSYDGLFLPIADVSDTDLSILNEKDGADKEPLHMLDQHNFWNKTALVFDTLNILKRSSPPLDKIRHYFNRMMQYITVSIITVFCSYLFIRRTADFNWINYAFFVTGIGGIIISILFQIQEFDRRNKFVNKICHSAKQHGSRDCTSILDSQDAKFLGLFSWADFGLLYFLYLIILVLFASIDVAVAATILVSLFASMYIPYSLYYQWHVARKWCALCLMTQGVLFVNLILSAWLLFSGQAAIGILWNFEVIFELIVIGIITMALLTTAKILLKQYRAQSDDSRYFAALKHDCTIKNDILQSRKEIFTEDIEKIVLQPDGTNIITVVFNPVCNPCMRKMRELLEIYKRKKETRLELIFLLNKNERYSYDTALSFLHYYFQDKERFCSFLTDYVTHFPGSSHRCVEVESLRNDFLKEIIADQDKWCMENKITSTPQLYLNGREMPAIYDINDIDYMIN